MNNVKQRWARTAALAKLFRKSLRLGSALLALLAAHQTTALAEGDVALYRKVLAQLTVPTLTYLGLRDAEIADDLAVWLAEEPLVAQLDTLDLSLGTIGDLGAVAVLNHTQLGKLKRLDLSHHYISEENQAKLKALPFEVVLDDPQEADEDDGESYRYVAVGE